MKIIQELIKLADILDKKGLYYEADMADKIAVMAVEKIKKMTFKEAVEKLRAVGLRIEKTDGGYRVWNPKISKERQEATEDEQSTLEDAVNTGLMAAKHGAW